jgi:hypothetical protein
VALTARQRSRARRLCEYDGLSDESIADLVGCSRRSLTNLKDRAEKKRDPWVKGKFSQELREKEQAAKVRAIEAQGWNEGRVLAELGLIAGSDIKDLLEVLKDGSVRMRDLKSLGEKSRVIKSIKQRKTMRKDGRGKEADTLEDSTLEVQVWDKLPALVKIGEQLGMFKTDRASAPSTWRKRRRRMADDTVSAPASAPATLRSGMDGHGLKFVPRSTIQDYKDRLYHGKPELNYKGIAYRQPKRIERANPGDRICVTGRPPVGDSLIKDLVADHFERTGRKATAITYPGVGGKYARGLTVPQVGLVFVDLIADSASQYDPYVSADKEA